MKYHKIHSIFKRDTKNKLIDGDYSKPDFKLLAYNCWHFKEKIDGTNIRVIWDGKLTFGGRTDNASIPAPLMNHLVETFKPEMFAGFNDITLFGEGYGAGIQKVGSLYSPTQKFILFDVRIGDYWLQWNSVKDIASQFNIPIVPAIGYGTLLEAINLVSSGLTSRISNNAAEGIVAIPEGDFLSRNGDRIITKIKGVDFL